MIEKLLAKTRRVLRLKAEVKLPQKNSPALLSNRHPITTSSPLGVTLQNSRHLLHHFQIEAEHRFQTWALNLENHLPAAAQAGAVHLGQRSRSKRVLIKIDDLGAAGTQFLLQQGLGLIKGEGRHLVLKISQLGHPPRWKHIRASRQQLSQLDERRAKLQKFPRQPTGPSLLPLVPALGSEATRIGPGLAIPPKKRKQHHHGTPNPQRTDATAPGGHQQPHATQVCSSKRLSRSATLALKRSIRS